MVGRNVKQFLVFGILGLFIISMMAGVLADELNDKTVAAAGEKVATELTNVKTFFKALFDGLGFKTDGDNKDWLQNLLFAILLGMIIYTVVSSFFAESGAFVQWGITIVVASISFIGIPNNYFEALTSSYGAMGLAILTVIPFLIMAVFTIKVKNLMIAKGTWGFYILYYFSLIVGRWFSAIADPKISSLPYLIAFFGGIAMFFTIPYIRYWFDDAKLDAYVETAEKSINRNIETQKAAKKSREGEVGAATS